MKSTDRKLFACEQEQEPRSRLASQAIDECKQEESDKDADDAAFWKAVYILMHIVGLLAALTMIYKSWGQ